MAAKIIKIIHKHSSPQTVITGKDLTPEVVEYCENNRKDFTFHYAGDRIVGGDGDERIPEDETLSLQQQHDEVIQQLSRYTPEYLETLNDPEKKALCFALTQIKASSGNEAYELILDYKEKALAEAEKFGQS